MKRAVGIIITNEKDQVLLMKRSALSGHDQGKWESCGGKCEENEAPEDCMKREAMEEIGTEIGYFELVYIDKPTEDREIYIYAAKLKSEPKLMESTMCDEIKWVEKSELAKMDLAEYSKQDFVKLGWI